MTRTLNILALVSTVVAMLLLNQTDMFANNPLEPPTDLAPSLRSHSGELSSDDDMINESDPFSDEDISELDRDIPGLDESASDDIVVDGDDSFDDVLEGLREKSIDNAINSPFTEELVINS